MAETLCVMTLLSIFQVIKEATSSFCARQTPGSFIS